MLKFWKIWDYRHLDTHQKDPEIRKGPISEMGPLEIFILVP
jgi:hypothetical protein